MPEIRKTIDEINRLGQKISDSQRNNNWIHLQWSTEEKKIFKIINRTLVTYGTIPNSLKHMWLLSQKEVCVYVYRGKSYLKKAIIFQVKCTK